MNSRPTHVIVCVPRTACRYPVEGSRPASCCRCGRGVWISPATGRAVPADAQPMCIYCAGEQITRADRVQLPSAEQLREAAAHLGVQAGRN